MAYRKEIPKFGGDNYDKFKNKMSNQSTQRYKQQMYEKSMKDSVSNATINAEPPKQRREGLNMNESKPTFADAKKGLFKEREVKEFTKSEHKSEYSKKESTKKPATLFNFRQNAKK